MSGKPTCWARGGVHGTRESCARLHPATRAWPSLAPLLGRLSRAVLLLFAVTPLSAQEPERVSGVPTCPDCQIELDTVVTIGGLDGPGLHLINTLTNVAVDRRGRILVSNKQQAEIAVFGADGKFIRTVGRRGQGPGEYLFISQVNVGPRFIHVLEYDRGRTMLDYDFNVVRTDRYTGQTLASVVLDSDDIVFNADVGTPSAAGHKFHILSPTGEIKSFGADGSVYMGRSARFFVLAGDGDSTLWAIPRDGTTATRWDLGIKPAARRIFARDVEGFVRDGTWPDALNLGAMLDDSGLWVVWYTGDPDWTGPLGQGEGISDFPPRVLFENWLDLIDPATGRTVSRLQHDGSLRWFANGSRYLIAYDETDEGVPYLHLLEPKLSGPPP